MLLTRLADGVLRLTLNRPEKRNALDSATIAAIKKFQAGRGLSPDGMAGTQTLILLYQVAGDYSPPRLTKNGEGTP